MDHSGRNAGRNAGRKNGILSFTGAKVPSKREDARAARIAALAEILRAERAAGVTRTSPKALAERAAQMGVDLDAGKISHLTRAPGVLRELWHALGGRSWGQIPRVSRTGWVLA